MWGTSDLTFAEEREYTGQQRAGLVTWHLAHGEGLRLEDVVALTALSREAARTLMDNLSCAIPIYCDEEGVWQACFLKEIPK